MTWPTWRRGEPAELSRFVLTGVLARLFPSEIRLPGRSGAPAEVRVRQLYEAFAAAGVRYADEEHAAAGEQQIRAPDQVFLRPGRGNCLDLAVAFAGGCLDAGLHPMIVTLAPSGPGAAAHAIVAVWLRGDLGGPQPYPLTAVVHGSMPPWPGMGLRATHEGTGEFVAVDVARAARGWPPGAQDRGAEHGVGFAEAVAAGAAMLASDRWRWECGVDVGLGWRPDSAHTPAGLPAREPLEPPYHAPVRDPGPLASVRARNRVVPFEPRDVLDELHDWCLADDPTPGSNLLRLMVLHGVGGSGKTRLAAELAAKLAEDEHWYAGFLRRDLTRAGTRLDDVTWLASVVGPVLLVVDYVEATHPETLAEVLRVLATRRDRTVVLLTARFPGDWRTRLDTELGSLGVHPEVRPDTRLDALHPRHEVVYRRAYRRFAPSTGAPDAPPRDLPPACARWTTLDVVMLGWLVAHRPERDVPPERSRLYEEILDRELANWNRDLRTRFGRRPTRPPCVARPRWSACCPRNRTPRRRRWRPCRSRISAAWPRVSWPGCSGGSSPTTPSPYWRCAPIRWPTT